MSKKEAARAGRPRKAAPRGGARAPEGPVVEDVAALRSKIQALETYAANVDKQVLLLGNELAFANCVKHGIVEPFFTTDTDFKLTFCNEAFAKLCARSPAELAAQPLAEFLRLEEQEVLAALEACVTHATAATALRCTLGTGRGAKARFVLHAGPLRTSTRQVVGLFCMLHDLSDIDGLAEKTRLLKMFKGATAQLTPVVSQLLATASEQNASLSQQSAAVSQTSSTLKEINHAAQQAAEHAQSVIDLAERAEAVALEGVGAMEESIKAASATREKVTGIAESVVQLSEQASRIGDIVATVNELAEQTNMLALNASIEAAKAGEFGKGFAVVAAEMRKLAEHSKRSTTQIRGILGEIQKVIRSVVKTTEDGSRKVEEGVQLATTASARVAKLTGTISDSSQAAKQIAVAARQQSIGIDQVASAMGNIAQATGDSVVGTKQLETAARELRSLAESMGSIAKDL
ncbi:MAG: methyl-accepting chemotaxis protein [Myxococcales bacterium]|nr:methyl-accepting chemotaxis protein [Myxococcales bacterium]